MSNDPLDYDPQLTDEERIEELEMKCATLDAQVDRQAKVVKAAQYWAKTNSPVDGSSQLREAVHGYNAAMTALAKGRVGDAESNS